MFGGGGGFWLVLLVVLGCCFAIEVCWRIPESVPGSKQDQRRAANVPLSLLLACRVGRLFVWYVCLLADLLTCVLARVPAT